MAESYSVEAILSMRDNMSGPLGNAQDSLGKFGSGIPNITGKLLGIGTIANVAGNAVSQAMSSIAGSVDGAIGRFDTLNNSTRVFENMGFSAQETASMMDNLNDSISGLPTPLDEAVSHVQRLASTNQDLDGSQAIYEALNNSVLTYGDGVGSVDSVVTAFSRSLGKGKVEGDEWNTMMDQMSPVLNAVAKEMGLTTEELRSGLSSGEVAMDSFTDTLLKMNDEGGGGLASLRDSARDATDGIKTSMANARTAVTRGLTEIIESIDTALSSNGLMKINEIIGAMGKGLEKALEAVAGVATTIIPKIAAALKGLVSGFTETFDMSALSGAFSALQSAVGSIIDAVRNMAAAFGISFESIGKAVGKVVNWLSKIIEVMAKVVDAVAGFVGRMDQGVLKRFTTLIAGSIGAFKAFNFLKTFNPVAAFTKNNSKSLNDFAGSTGNMANNIRNIFNGIGNIIKSFGTAISVAAKGIGNGLNIAFRGLGTAIQAVAVGIGKSISMILTAIGRMDPLSILSFGAAVATAAVGIGAGIAIISAGFALLATQSSGVSEILQAVSGALGNLASTIIDALANAIVTVSGVFPVFTQALANLSPLILAIGTAIAATAPFVTALGEAISAVALAIGTAISQIIEALTPVVEIIATTITSIVQIIADAVVAIVTALTPIIPAIVQIVTVITGAFTQIVTVIANAIVQIVEALAPFIPSITAMALAVAPVLQTIVEAFTLLIEQIRPIIDGLVELIEQLGETIATVFDAIGGVLESFGEMVNNILSGVSDVITSIGDAAMKAGEGFKLFADAISQLVALNILDLAATMGTLAASIGNLGNKSGDMQALGTAMQGFTSALTTLNGSINGTISQFSAFNAGVRTAVTTVTQAAAQITQSAQRGMQGMTSSMRSGMTQAVSIARSTSSQVVSAFRGLSGQLRAIGVQAGAGFRVGLASQRSSVIATARSMANAVSSTIQGALKIHSPARVTMSDGSDTGEGFNVGLASWITKVRSTAGDIANASRINSSQSLDRMFQDARSQLGNFNSNSIVSHEFNNMANLEKSIRDLTVAVESGQVIMLDTGDLVGGTVNQYDNALGDNINLYGERWHRK